MEFRFSIIQLEPSKKMDNEQTFNYEKASEVLKEISTYFEFPQFQQTFGDNTENVIKLSE